jgi:Bacterial antitoxin of ParD toxin-antitoxin type II system and RHH
MPINVNLTPELEGLIRQKVSSGRYNSASEVMREAAGGPGLGHRIPCLAKTARHGAPGERIVAALDVTVCGPLVELSWPNGGGAGAQVSGPDSHVSQNRRDMGHPIFLWLSVETF